MRVETIFVFLHSITSSHACLGVLNTLLRARSRRPTAALPSLSFPLTRGSLTVSGFSGETISQQFKHRFFSIFPHLKHVDRRCEVMGQYRPVRGIYAMVASIVFTPPGFKLGALTLALVSKLWNIRRWRYRRVCTVPMNELHFCGVHQQVAVQGHKTYALCTGEGAWGRVWAVFNLVSISGTDKHLKIATGRRQQGVGFQGTMQWWRVQSLTGSPCSFYDCTS